MRFNSDHFKKGFSDLLELRNNAIVQNIVLVGCIMVFVKIISFYKETLIASEFGLSMILDTFLIAMMIPNIINNIFLVSFKNAFIPNYVAEMKSGNSLSAFQGTAFFITTGISFFFLLLTYIFTDVFVEIIFPGHEPDYYMLIRNQLYYLLPCILIWGISSLLAGILNIKGEYLFSTISGIFLPLVIILFLLLFKEELGYLVLSVSTLIGSIIVLIFLISVAAKKKLLFIGRPDFKTQNARVMLAQLPPKITSSFLMGMHNLIDLFFAAQLIIGSISALNYSKKLPAFALGVLAIAMSNVLLPYFSKQVLRNKDRAYGILFRMLKYVFAGAVVISLFFIFTSDYIIALFFERREFTHEDTILVSGLQQIILIYLPFKVGSTLLVNFLTSINKNNYLAINSFISVIINIILDYYLMMWYGVYGIAIATTAVVVIRSILLFIYTLKTRKAITPS